MKNLDIFNELSEYIAIKINSCRHEFHEACWSESKIHSDYDLWLILEGSMHIEVYDRIFSTNPGDVVLFYPDMPYTAHMGNIGCRFIYTHFDFSIGSNIKMLECFNFSGIIPYSNIEEETRIFRKACEAYAAKSDMSLMLLKGAFTILLSAIINSCAVKKSENCFMFRYSKQENTNRLKTLQPILNYISMNIDKPLRIYNLSKIAGMSEKYFITYFKNVLGISPGSYINQLKMNRARDYLHKRTYSVKQIAHMLGYPDQYSFSKAFKKYYNIPPSKFI